VPHTTRLTPEAVQKELKRALRKGARASRLVLYSRDLVELLVPASSTPAEAGIAGQQSAAEKSDAPVGIHDRAIAAEGIIRDAIERIGGSSGEALHTIFCLKPGTLGLTLEQRRQMAGELLGMQGETFRRYRHEGLLIWDLAMEVYGVLVNAARPQAD
jgi:hypothetical protein